MPHLDRFLTVLVSQRGDALRLAADDVALLELGGRTHPVTKQPLTAQQLLAILREVAPADALRLLDGGEAASFGYATSDGSFRAQARFADGRLAVTIALDRQGTPADPAAGTNGHNGGNGSTTRSGNGGGAPAAPVRPSAATGAPRAEPRAQSQPDGAAQAAARAEIDGLLRRLVEGKASDLHLRVGEPPILRLNGEMTRIDGTSALTNVRLEAMLLSVMPERNRGEFAELNDTDFAYEISGLARFRCNALRDRHGAGAVVRVIPATVATVEQLELSDQVQKLCYLTKGLVLVTGPTGSGKSTTLCALIDFVNRVRSDHVITIEDPIEFVHTNKKCLITQRQVGVHTTSFKHALRAALREDPDIVLVGELRDLETVSIAIETAETGHLVFGTLHTTTAPSTVDRLIDQFPADRQEQIRMMLADSLKGVISQTLCKKIGGGRIAAREVLLQIPAVSNLIREGKTFQIPSIIQTSKRLGMVTLNDALIELVDAKQVEPKEAYMRAVEKTGFVNSLRQRGHDTSFLDATEEPAVAGGKPEGGPKGAPRAGGHRS